ncbi:recombinase RecA [Desulfofundulus thermobenzoicus]|uniref:Protein RecA n=1 Tax=Desulfofundulus thermobenzoicus TaxID=29376 RepID=A0A6N7IRE1_9FIRM|nr:recombinase RecA [Desulfofundulus thermobenzoicus]MQL52057.1 recombinase RecA [Desulfofundulus thermobenzoicus]
MSKTASKPATREEVLEKTLNEIKSKFGDGAIMRLGENPKMNVQVIPTGILSLDLATGVGGLPRGRIIELFGPESSGKTTVALHVIAEAQKTGGIAAFIDAEHALDPVYAKNLGVDIESLLVSQPDYGEQALEICNMLVVSAAVDVVVIDSVAALVPKSEIDGEMGDAHVGLQARLMSQAMRKLTAIASRNKTVVIFINQLREKVGDNKFGPTPEVTPGGRALKFYSSMRLDVRKKEAIKDGNEVIGSRTAIKIVKNKVAPPFRETAVDLFYGEGISKELDVLDMALEYKIVQKSAAWISYNGDHLGQGRENVRKFLKAHPEMVAELSQKVVEKIGAGAATADNAGEENAAESKVVYLARDPE